MSTDTNGSLRLCATINNDFVHSWKIRDVSILANGGQTVLHGKISWTNGKEAVRRRLLAIDAATTAILLQDWIGLQLLDLKNWAELSGRAC